MKYRIVVFGFLTACSGIGDFEVTRETDEVLVEGSPAVVPVELPVNVIPDLVLSFDLESALEEQDAKGAKAVRLVGLTLETTETAKADEDDEDTLGFLDRIEFYVAAEGLEERLVAQADEVPDVETLDLETDASVNLKPYAEKGIVITTKGDGSQPPDDVTVKGIVTLEIEVL